jgi:hypothetical protein
MINNLSEPEFAEILHRNISPTVPIQSEEHLFGRTKQLNLVQQALYAPGRSIFIYGDRGVGKTSLAQTVAFSHQSATHDPVMLACEPKTTFAGLMNSALVKLRDTKPKTPTSTSINAKASAKLFSFELGGKRNRGAETTPEPITDLNELITALLLVGKERQNENIVIIVDEFDRITDDTERTHFADFIKQIGDQSLPFHFVFCGVSDSLQKLLGAHESAYRYLEGIPLGTLSYEARYEIIDNVGNAFKCQIVDPQRHRISTISDGFPHYIHRMCERLLWQMFLDPHPCSTPTAAHYREAVIESIRGIEQHLSHTYEHAILKEAPGYEQVLWAVADHSDMIRNTDSIYRSYVAIMNDGEESEDILDRQTVVTRLNTLKGKSSANILASKRRGYYMFRESIIRGYVRLRAEEQGCELLLDLAAASAESKDLKWRPRSSGRSRRFGTRPEDKRKTEFHG